MVKQWGTDHSFSLSSTYKINTNHKTWSHRKHSTSSKIIYKTRTEGSLVDGSDRSVATKYFLPKPADIMYTEISAMLETSFKWAAKISVHPEWCFRLTYKSTGEERVMMGFGSMNWQTYRSIQHYELQPGVKQKKCKVRRPWPLLSQHTATPIQLDWQILM